ncbi:general secretion pathway protein GspH [Pulveribacter suum]|uniref:Type II secretion system protein H n=2 Tax=Pulveribacter suum TaxID=2116657 RepID=A0A2P1NJS4_9BURK|nr:GspH/FimT family protein [Pulveribacter suum]AVP57324.1 general secretion pathway protein GspH [Pulveribacter suum]
MRSPHPPLPCKRKLHLTGGFTIVELMVVVAILAILAALAAPSFAPIVERWRVRQAVEGLQSTLYYARSEAIKRGGKVVLRKNPQDTEGCQQADLVQAWGCGWFVFVDTNDNGTRQASEELLQTIPPVRNLDVMRTPSGEFLRFDRFGMAGANMQSFTISPVGPGVTSPATSTLCMSSGGRIRVLTGDVVCN